MERMTIKRYATQNKLSIFNVVKMIKSGALKSETVEENGKEVTYILLQEDVKHTQDTANDHKTEDVSLAEKVAYLEREVAVLKRELDALKIGIGLR